VCLTRDPLLPLDRCGVELDLPVGKNSGTVKGHKYFKCAPKHGVLCPTKWITFIDDSAGESGESFNHA
jgi:hypothetical protein